MAAAALSLPLSRIASNQGSIAIKEHQRAKRRRTSPLSLPVTFKLRLLTPNPPHSHSVLPLDPPPSTQLSTKIAQCDLYTASYGAASSSPPSIASLTRGSNFGPTTIGMGTTRSASGAPLAALAVGAGRPLDPTFVAATVSASTSSSAFSTSPSTSSSPTPSTRALPTSDEAVPVTAAGAVAVVDQAKKAGWLKTIIPDKLIHYDPSRDPRLHSL